MPRLVRLTLVITVLVASLPATPAVVVATSVARNRAGATEVATTVGAAGTCEDGQHSNGALYRICMPASDAWNGELVVFAHGYVAPDDPLEIPEDQMRLPAGMSMPEIANRLGFAFATTSYSINGLAIREGVADVRDLVGVFTQTYGQPRRVYLVGGSEGGIVTALAVEQHPDVFDGGLVACGPVGDFRRQANYWGDFRVVFDYFFPDLIPGSPIDVPQEVVDNWDSVYVPAIRDALRANQRATDQLLRVTHAAIDRHETDSVEETILGLLWYNVFATNDGIAKLKGQPFDNSHRAYYGSYNDWRLNRQVQRFQADQSALDEIEAYYQTSGRLTSPLVTLHNTGDPFVPYWHEPLYRWKAFWNGSSSKHSNIPALRYGHCNFNLVEGVAAFAVLYLKVTGSDLLGVEAVLPDAGSQAKFQKLLQEYGAER